MQQLLCSLQRHMSAGCCWLARVTCQLCQLVLLRQLVLLCQLVLLGCPRLSSVSSAGRAAAAHLAQWLLHGRCHCLPGPAQHRQA